MQTRNEFDTIVVYNPTDEDFGEGFNGQFYTLKANDSHHFPWALGLHLAKHLSTKMIAKDFQKEKATALKKKEDWKDVVKVQRLMYDNPHRRIALYKILRDKDLVAECVQSYNLKGFVGEMGVYDKFVADTIVEAESSQKEVSPPSTEK